MSEIIDLPADIVIGGTYRDPENGEIYDCMLSDEYKKTCSDRLMIKCGFVYKKPDTPYGSLWGGSKHSDPSPGAWRKRVRKSEYVQDDVRLMVLRPGPVAMAPNSKGDSPWNGICSRCGKGTYSGLFSVEHEDGGCKWIGET